MAKDWSDGLRRVLLSIGIVCAVFLPVASAADKGVSTLKMVFAGDVMGHDMQITAAKRDGGDTAYNYHPPFQWVKDYISAADVAVANLEVTLGVTPYTGYPQFSSHESLAAALRDAGFDVLLTANNHTLDRGKRGVMRTLAVLDSLGIPHTGTFRDSAEFAANYPLIVTKNDFRLALLNYTYGTNGITADKPNVVNYIDTSRIAADLAKARSLKPDYTIVCVHWGEEYKNVENAEQRRLAEFFVRHGANLIVGSHPHVVQPLTKIPVAGANDSVPVIYSLGNFISNQRDRYRDGGVTLEVSLTKTNGAVALQSVGYEPFWVYRYNENNRGTVFRLIGINDYLKNPERYPVLGENDKKTMMLFFEDTKKIMGNVGK